MRTQRKELKEDGLESTIMTILLCLVVSIATLAAYNKFFTTSSGPSHQIAYISIDDWIAPSPSKKQAFLDAVLDELQFAADNAAAEGYIVFKSDVVYSAATSVKILPGDFGSRTLEELHRSLYLLTDQPITER